MTGKGYLCGSLVGLAVGLFIAWLFLPPHAFLPGVVLGALLTTIGGCLGMAAEDKLTMRRLKAHNHP